MATLNFLFSEIDATHQSSQGKGLVQQGMRWRLQKFLDLSILLWIN
jgi:hypothetical protein